MTGDHIVSLLLRVIDVKSQLTFLKLNLKDYGMMIMTSCHLATS